MRTIRKMFPFSLPVLTLGGYLALKNKSEHPFMKL
jgi:hypothetical protein